MLGSVVFGSRTWMWTIAAPALAASIAEVAICSGVTGTAGFLPTESAEPVTAHEIMTLRCIIASHYPLLTTSLSCRAAAGYGVAMHSHRRTLHPIVRCAKPPLTRSGTNPNWNQGRFVRSFGALGQVTGRTEREFRTGREGRR